MCIKAHSIYISLKMNFNIRSSSQHLSSSSNSDSENDDNVSLINDIEAINAHEEAIISIYGMNLVIQITRVLLWLLYFSI